MNKKPQIAQLRKQISVMQKKLDKLEEPEKKEVPAWIEREERRLDDMWFQMFLNGMVDSPFRPFPE